MTAPNGSGETRRYVPLRLLGFSVLLVAPSAASAVNKNFTGPLNGGAWNVAANWTPGRHPDVRRHRLPGQDERGAQRRSCPAPAPPSPRLRRRAADHRRRGAEGHRSGRRHVLEEPEVINGGSVGSREPTWCLGRSRFELGVDAVVGALELRAANGAGGRYGTGELRATGSSLLLATHLGGGRTVFDGPVRIETVSENTFVTDGAVLRTNGPTDWRLGGVDLPSGTWENTGTITIGNASGVTALSGLLKNSGTIAKTAAGTFFGLGSVENSGTVDVAAGRFGMGGTFTMPGDDERRGGRDARQGRGVERGCAQGPRDRALAHQQRRAWSSPARHPGR